MSKKWYDPDTTGEQAGLHRLSELRWITNDMYAKVEAVQMGFRLVLW